MTPAAAKRLRLLASTLSVLLLLAIVAVGWFYSRVRKSLPQLDGTARVAGLAAEVTLERDAAGVPTIRGRDRLDVSRVLGWLHAQDRFFQMDLLRRNAAGELAELFGKRALPVDRGMRRHGFRALAQRVMAQLDAGERAMVEAYTAGVNSGLSMLPEHPFEYMVLRQTPAPWRAEDTVLVIYAMTLDLQDENGRYEQTLMTLRDQIGVEAVSFFNPLVLPTDAALDGSTAPLPPIPGPRRIDLRKDQGTNKDQGTKGPKDQRTVRALPAESLGPLVSWSFGPDASASGSNAFALAGTLTASGAALLVNDMHLDHGVPNIWYRASLEFDGRKITGVTLPGAPALVAGSNGHIAWGFTNSYADVSDLVVVETEPGTPRWYVAPGQPEGLKIEQRKETIRVKGSADVTVDYDWTIWGPVVGQDERGKPLALKWIAHDMEATNLGIMALESARSVGEAVAIAHRAGMPAQNLLVADRAGDVAWTIAGRLPKRVGYDGRLPVSWAYGDRRWDGFLPPDDVPVVTTKPREGNAAELGMKDGRIWSGNQRKLGGDALAKLGDGDYARPSRAGQIRDGLAAIERATPKDLLAVQLDNRALFLERWHKLMMEILTPAVTAEKKSRAGLRSFAEKWEGRADTDAVSYRLVREFRLAVHARVFRPIFASCFEAMPRFAWSDLQLDPAFWAIWSDKPPHLLDPDFKTWEELLVAAADDVIAQLDRQGVKLPHANWGWRNTARIRHPLGHNIPSWLGKRINMPAEPLAGGDDMPRVQSPGHGASERLVVSPGREEEGIFHMPGGQSGHPLSPFYRAGHEAWVRGEPTPFLPGTTQHRLRLTP